MIITVTNPINNEEVEIEARVTINVMVDHNGLTILSATAVGSVEV
jgi:hypothetical protein